MGCWCCGGDHRRELCEADKSKMKCNICAMENSHVSSVCLQQFAGAAVGQPSGRPPTPGLQAGMVALEGRRMRKRTYAQAAGSGSPVSATHSPPPSSIPHPPSSTLLSDPDPLPGPECSGRPAAQLESTFGTAGPAAGADPERSGSTQDAYAGAAEFTADQATSSRPSYWWRSLQVMLLSS